MPDLTALGDVVGIRVHRTQQSPSYACTWQTDHGSHCMLGDVVFSFRFVGGWCAITTVRQVQSLPHLRPVFIRERFPLQPGENSAKVGPFLLGPR